MSKGNHQTKLCKKKKRKKLINEKKIKFYGTAV